jgi:hypothetical protein
MKPLPKTTDCTIYIYLLPDGGVYACTTAGIETQLEHGWKLLGSENVTVAVTKVNPVTAELEQLSRRETAVRAQFDEAMGNIKGRRAELLALEWQPEGDA